jgi:hypothetical protein
MKGDNVYAYKNKNESIKIHAVTIYLPQLVLFSFWFLIWDDHELRRKPKSKHLIFITE